MGSTWLYPTQDTPYEKRSHKREREREREREKKKKKKKKKRFSHNHIPDPWSNEYSVRQWSGRPGFNPRSSYTKDSKNGT